MDDEGEAHTCFAALPPWRKEFETLVRPLFENELNRLIEVTMSAENQVRDEGVELAIRRYGLRPISQDEDEAGPSTSQVDYEPEVKKTKFDSVTDNVLVSAVCSAIACKGLARVPGR